MAKRGKSGNGKEGSGAKLPKEIAGVKLPKRLRKAGKQALKLAGKPIVSEVVAAALLTAAAALRDSPAAKGKAKAAGAAAGSGARGAGKLGGTLRALALDLARNSLDAWEQGSSGGKRAGRAGKAGKPG